MKGFSIAALALLVFFSCSRSTSDQPAKTEPAVTTLSGKELATVYCARCHALVDPQMLPRYSWEQDVLPSMGHRLGIYKGDHQPDSLFANDIGGTIVRRANIYPEEPLLAKEDWIKLVKYYVDNAPDSIAVPERKQNITIGLKHFRYKETSYSHRPALTSMVKILPDKRGIVYSDGKRNGSILTFLSTDLKKKYDLNFSTTPISYYEHHDTLYLTTAGNGVFPNDVPAGTFQKVYKAKGKDVYSGARVMVSKMQRPVDMVYGDLNNDGREDVVACEYGNLTGKLVWFENKGNDYYSENFLRGTAGAIKAIVKDVNGDSLKDIVVLVAQGDEGVFVYINKGKGRFEEKRILTFPPLFGSQYIELVDLNKDGFEDLVYVCGDNADSTPFLKSYHGIYVYFNDGKFNFTKHWFYQLNGAYKAIPRDFDLDGDIDIAAISFFPDYERYPEESFVYLENKGNFKFKDYSFPESTKGRWIVMDANDMDGDGDIDLALGSFVYFEAMGDKTGLGRRWLKEGPSVVVLENTIR